MVLRDVSEDQLLESIFPFLPGGEHVLVGPGDDTALMRADGSVLATTDTMVRGLDWRDEWSTGADVGAKAVVQNAADIAAMGGVTTGLLVTLVADPDTQQAWVADFARGLGAKARELGIAVLGGDLSAAGSGVLLVSVTALGTTEGREPVLRSGAQAGDVLAVSGPLGRAAAGLHLLSTGWRPGGGGVAGVGTEALAASLVDSQRSPSPDLSAGPAAARAGAHAMIDISDGLGRDAGRLARASGLRVELDEGAVRDLAAPLVPAVGEREAVRAVLTGGEEHVLLAAFAPAEVPAGWVIVGSLVAGQGAWMATQDVTRGGWDHFGAPELTMMVSYDEDHRDCDGSAIDPDPVPARS